MSARGAVAILGLTVSAGCTGLLALEDSYEVGGDAAYDAPTSDGAAPDASASDAGPLVDVRLPEVNAPDMNAPDASREDSGGDSGSPDAGSTDSAAQDAMPTDSGRPHEAGPDSGSPCAKPAICVDFSSALPQGATRYNLNDASAAWEVVGDAGPDGSPALRVLQTGGTGRGGVEFDVSALVDGGGFVCEADLLLAGNASFATFVTATMQDGNTVTLHRNAGRVYMQAKNGSPSDLGDRQTGVWAHYTMTANGPPVGWTYTGVNGRGGADASARLTSAPIGFRFSNDPGSSGSSEIFFDNLRCGPLP